MTTTLNQVTIDVPLVTEDGEVITTELGEPIIVDSFSFRVESEDLPALTPDEALEFKKGRKLAVTPDGPPKSWEVRILEKSDGTTEYLTVFNLRFLGGRHSSLYRALGQISGTYIRFGSKGIPDSLVGGVYGVAAPTGPFAQLGNLPASVEEGDITFTVNAGNGDITLYEWSISNGQGTEFTPSGPTLTSTTQTLTAGSWTISCDVTIDGSIVTTAPRVLTVTVPNQAPNINTFVVAPAVVGEDIEGQDSTIAFQATDDSGGTLSYTIVGDQGTNLAGNCTSGITEILTGVMPAGLENYTLTISDGNGGITTATTSVTGQINATPVINFVTPARIPGGGVIINSGDTVRVTASYTDLNNTPVDYVITQDGTTVASGTTSAKSIIEDITNVTSTSGFVVTLTDTIDPTLTATTTSVGLSLNTAPSLTTSLTVGATTMTLNGVVTDDFSGTDDITYTWEVFKDGVSIGNTANFNNAVTLAQAFDQPLAIWTASTDPGTYTFACTVTDELGASTTVTAAESFVVTAPTFVPSDLTETITWFSADSLSLSDGAAVTSWTSEIDSSTAATQGNGTRQPAYVASSSDNGNQPAVFFDGGADGGAWDTLTWTQSDLNVGSDDLVCIVVGNPDTRSGTPFSTLGRGSNSAASLQGLFNGANSLFSVSAGTDTETNISITGKTGGTQYRSVVYGRYDGALTARWSGDELSSRGASTVGLTATSYALISAYYSGGAEGEVSDVIFLKNPSLSDIEKVEGWAAHKYGYTSELPAAHPYKTSAP